MAERNVCFEVEDSVFERIIKREAPAEILYEDDKLIAFLDKYPRAPGHFLVVPKLRSTNLIDIDEATYLHLMKVSRQLAIEQMERLKVSGFKLVVNNGAKADQVIFHTHIHIIPALE